MPLDPILGAGYITAVSSLVDQLNDGEGVTVMPNQPDSVAADVAALVVDFNLLLDKLKAAGYMEVDA